MTYTPELTELGMSRVAVNKLTAELKRLETINADLLAALQDMVAWYPDNPHHPIEVRAARWRAQDAIAKATGE